MIQPRTTSGKQALTDASGDPSFDGLPEGVKTDITHHEWRWLSDMEKARFLQTLTEPEAFDDGT